MPNFEKDGFNISLYALKKLTIRISDTVGSSASEKENGAAIFKRCVDSVSLTIIVWETVPFLTLYLRFHFDSVGCLLSARFVEDHIHLQ